ncbi:5'-nucleotidase C-terminal domain-containing protein [Nitratireductor thuwali]|uniref:Trifunctional nucleotide phosphoesterase protein YfkN n=1 Tax=Nitratireductor thuwali TaxID=2267699 RepID=A0ABY5MHY8_9HYPH|nr:Trifunctional nucleotide phosphoesterase protein YfkN [Nitratireductor thuwali]
MNKLALLALTSSALALTATQSFADYTLNILHINDWHSRIESINKYDSTCSAEDEAEGNCFGGAARLVTAVRDRRKALDGQNVLFLNAGDNFQGSLFYTTYKGEVEAEFLNLMGTDAMVVGNHEFDDGEDGLAAFLDKAEFPVLGSNVKASEASSLGDRVKQYVILEEGGEKIGIVGAVANDTAELSSPGENVSIIEDVEGITAAVEAAKAEGVNKIIAVTHVGYPRDLAAIAKIPGVDVVVGGHTNTLLSNTIEGAEGPYPTMVDNPGGYQVPVVQAGSYSKYLGELKVVFNDEGVVTQATGDVHLLDATVQPDEAAAERVAELGGPIEELKQKVVAQTTAPIDGSRENCRAGECEMGNAVTDAMLARTKDQGVDFAITNGGGLRASIDEGEVTMGEVLGVLPFQNTLATFQIKGEDVVASLESGVSQIEEGAGRFPQVSGLRFSFDPSVAPGEGRVSDVEVSENGEWQPIDPDKTYSVATNNFMRNGGDGYKLFAENAENAYDYGPGLEEVLADYLADNSPYQPTIDGRITKVGASTAAAGAAEEEATGPATGAEGEGAEAAAETTVEPAEENATEAADETGEPAEEMTAEGAAEGTEQPGEEDGAEAGSGTTGDASEATTDTPGASEAAATGEAGSHTIARGDTYWDLAQRYYGDPRKWRTLAEANPNHPARRLTVGTTITIPAAE